MTTRTPKELAEALRTFIYGNTGSIEVGVAEAAAALLDAMPDAEAPGQCPARALTDGLLDLRCSLPAGHAGPHVAQLDPPAADAAQATSGPGAMPTGGDAVDHGEALRAALRELSATLARCLPNVEPPWHPAALCEVERLAEELIAGVDDLERQIDEWRRAPTDCADEVRRERRAREAAEARVADLEAKLAPPPAPPVRWRASYSVDGGSTWKTVGADFDFDTEARALEALLPILAHRESGTVGRVDKPGKVTMTLYGFKKEG